MKLLTLQLVCTWFMVGVIWMVQVVHYPLFAQVGEADFAAYEALHTRWITFVVAVPMLLELIFAGFWMIDRDPRISRWVTVIGGLLVLVIWFATFAFSVPSHSRLMQGFDPAAWSSLVATNWIRTLAWTLRGALLVFALFQISNAASQTPAR